MSAKEAESEAGLLSLLHVFIKQTFVSSPIYQLRGFLVRFLESPVASGEIDVTGVSKLCLCSVPYALALVKSHVADG